MANGAQDFGKFAKWAYGRATSRPIKKIVTTLNTGKPPKPDQASSTEGMKQSTIAPQWFKRYGPPIPTAKSSGISNLKKGLIKKGR